MDPVLPKILELARLSSKGYYPLTFGESDSSFHSFLIHARLIPLLQMALIEKYGGTFSIGFAKTSLFVSQDDEEDHLTATYGPNLIDATYSGEQLFDFLLDEFGLAQVMVTAPKTDLPRRTQKEIIPYPEWPEYFMDEVRVMFSDQFIFTKDSIFVKDKSAEQLVRQKQKEFEPFVHEHRKDVTIPHTYYTEVLLRWFPGKIKIRQLT